MGPPADGSYSCCGSDGRPLKRAPDLNGLGTLGAGGARPGALRDGDGRDRTRRALGARLGSARGAGARRPFRGRDAARADLAGSGHPRRGRRRLPGAARSVRRGRHGAGAARARKRALRGCRRDRLGPVHGQGPLQVRAPRPRHPGHPKRDPARWRRLREPVRLSRLREACPARLVRGDYEGAQRRGA